MEVVLRLIGGQIATTQKSPVVSARIYHTALAFDATNGSPRCRLSMQDLQMTCGLVWTEPASSVPESKSIASDLLQRAPERGASAPSMARGEGTGAKQAAADQTRDSEEQSADQQAFKTTCRQANVTITSALQLGALAVGSHDPSPGVPNAENSGAKPPRPPHVHSRLDPAPLGAEAADAGHEAHAPASQASPLSNRQPGISVETQLQGV